MTFWNISDVQAQLANERIIESMTPFMFSRL